jgi:hypothetical protein
MNILRIKFVMPTQSSFDLDGFNEFSIKLSDQSLKFKISTSESSSYRTYILKSNEFDFNFNDLAIEKVINSLYLTSLDFGNGILMNPNLKSSWFAKTFLEELKLQHGVNMEDDFIGVRIIPSNTKFVGSPPLTLHAKSSIRVFEDSMNSYLNLEYTNSDNLIRAIEIYNSSNYLNVVNQSARFILYMSAIEALIEQKKVSKRLESSLSSYINRIKHLIIDNEEKTSIIGSLNRLKKMSIKRSGKILVRALISSDKKYNGFSPEDFFSKAYDLRSNFVHYGITSTKELDIKNIQMQTFTSDLLKEYFKKICCKTNNKLVLL